MTDRVWCRVCGRPFKPRTRAQDGTVWAGTTQPNPHLNNSKLCTGADLPAMDTDPNGPRERRKPGRPKKVSSPAPPTGSSPTTSDPSQDPPTNPDPHQL